MPLSPLSAENRELVHQDVVRRLENVLKRAAKGLTFEGRLDNGVWYEVVIQKSAVTKIEVELEIEWIGERE